MNKLRVIEHCKKEGGEDSIGSRWYKERIGEVIMDGKQRNYMHCMVGRAPW